MLNSKYEYQNFIKITVTYNKTYKSYEKTSNKNFQDSNHTIHSTECFESNQILLFLKKKTANHQMLNQYIEKLQTNIP